jgi:ATP-dependent Lon protease
VPKDNEKDLADIPKNVLDVLNIHMVSHMDEVLKIALTGPLTPIPPTPDSDFDESADATTH